MFQGGPIKLFFEFRGLFLGLENFFFLFAQIHALKIWWKILVCYQIPWHRHAGSEVGKNVSSNNFKQCDTNRKFRLKILYYKMLSDFKNISDPFHFCPAWSSLNIFLKSKIFLQNKIFSQSKKKFFFWRYLLDLDSCPSVWRVNNQLQNWSYSEHTTLLMTWSVKKTIDGLPWTRC